RAPRPTGVLPREGRPGVATLRARRSSTLAAPPLRRWALPEPRDCPQPPAKRRLTPGPPRDATTAPRLARGAPAAGPRAVAAHPAPGPNPAWKDRRLRAG